MIIQKVIKGISETTSTGRGINDARADYTFEEGILCNWWLNVNNLLAVEIGKRLTENNLNWHQNHYLDPDPAFGGAPFCENTPFISTTAGCVERDDIVHKNVQHRAWFEAIRFASNFWTSGGYLFYCHLFVLGKQSIGYEQFAEELRELNVYQNYSQYHPEGEVTAKIVIRGVQIEKWEYYDFDTIQRIKQAGALQPGVNHIPPTRSNYNTGTYLVPEAINNIRELI